MDADRHVTLEGRRAEVLAYIAEQLDYLDQVAERTGTPPPTQEQMPLDRIRHLEGLVRCVRLGAQSDPRGVPSPHYLRALAAQSCAWLEDLRNRGEASW